MDTDSMVGRHERTTEGGAPGAFLEGGIIVMPVRQN